MNIFLLKTSYPWGYIFYIAHYFWKCQNSRKIMLIIELWIFSVYKFWSYSLFYLILSLNLPLYKKGFIKWISRFLLIYLRSNYKFVEQTFYFKVHDLLQCSRELHLHIVPLPRNIWAQSIFVLCTLIYYLHNIILSNLYISRACIHTYIKSSRCHETLTKVKDVNKFKSIRVVSLLTNFKMIGYQKND